MWKQMLAAGSVARGRTHSSEIQPSLGSSTDAQDAPLGSNSGPSGVASSASAAVQEVVSTPSRTNDRPVGTKRSLELASQSVALQKGAKVIEDMAKAASKRNKIAQEFVDAEKEKNMIKLFSMPGTSSEHREEFMKLSQERALEDLRKKSGASNPEKDAEGDDLV